MCARWLGWLLSLEKGPDGGIPDDVFEHVHHVNFSLHSVKILHTEHVLLEFSLFFVKNFHTECFLSSQQCVHFPFHFFQLTERKRMP